MKRRRSDNTEARIFCPVFSVTPGAAAAFAAAVLFLDEDTLLCLFISSVIHECGHLLSMKALHVNILEIRAEASGLNIRYFGCPYLSELLCALAGPLSGAAAAFLFSRAGCPALAGAGAILTAFNLLPVLPLDGGRAVRAALCLLISPDTAEKAMRISGIAAALSLTGLAAFLRLGIYPVIFSAWLLYGYCKNPRNGVK